MSELKLTADSGGGTVSFKGPATTTGNAAVPFVLPVADGSAGQYLKTDGSKNLGWASDAGAVLNTYSRTAAQLNGNNAITVTGLDGSAIKKLWFIGWGLSNDSSSGNNRMDCRIGDSGGLETSGYTTTFAKVGSSSSGHNGDASWEVGNGSGGGGDTDCFFFNLAPALADGTSWVCDWKHGQMPGAGGTWMNTGIGTKVLSAELDRISFYWVNSHDFDAGYAQVFWLT